MDAYFASATEPRMTGFRALVLTAGEEIIADAVAAPTAVARDIQASFGLDLLATVARQVR